MDTMEPETPETLSAIAEQLRTDSPIDVLERVEHTLKERLKRELAAPLDGRRMRELASFQQNVGFLLKYKSYAIKAANPLGYSVFLQRPGEGFSFQRHVTHKTEIFYILDVLPGGYVFLCDFEEWKRAYQRDAFLAWLGGKPDERYERFRFVPQPGDVIVIDRLNVVHTVMGCTLAEFATVSTDMVDRLHDQNEHHLVPARIHPGLCGAAAAPPGLARRVAMGDRAVGWSRRAIPRPSRGGVAPCSVKGRRGVDLPVRRRRGERPRRGPGARGVPAYHRRGRASGAGRCRRGAPIAADPGRARGRSLLRRAGRPLRVRQRRRGAADGRGTPDSTATVRCRPPPDDDEDARYEAFFGRSCHGEIVPRSWTQRDFLEHFRRTPSTGTVHLHEGSCTSSTRK